MKTNKLWFGLAACALLATGCAKEQVEVKSLKGDGDASLVVSIAAQGATRSIIGTSDQAKIDNYEKQVVDFTAYIFNEAGQFIESGSTAAGTDRVIFPGYTAGDKVQVVAFANVDSSDAVLPVLTEGQSITGAFADVDVSLSSQLPTSFDATDEGFLMSGQFGANAQGNITVPTAALFPIAEGENIITVPVERVVAKVLLGDITFGGGVTFGDLARFTMKGAGIQKAISDSYAYPGEITVNPDPVSFYGSFADGSTSAVMAGMSDVATGDTGLINLQGLLTTLLGGIGDNLGTLLPGLGLLSTVVGGLIDGALGLTGGVLTLSDTLLGYVSDIPVIDILAAMGAGVNLEDLIAEPNAFWYVLPNNGQTVVGEVAAATLLTLQATYDGNNYYYPIAINTTDANVEGSNDGTFVRRNTKYRINVQFNSLLGTDNPDDPNQGTNLIVKVQPIAWEGEIDQNATW